VSDSIPVDHDASAFLSRSFGGTKEVGILESMIKSMITIKRV
jgi:hypothetical protein